MIEPNKSVIVRNVLLYAYESNHLDPAIIPDELADEAIEFVDYIIDTETEAILQYLSQYGALDLFTDLIQVRQGFGGFPLITGTNAKEVFEKAVSKFDPLEVPQELVDNITGD